MNSTSPFMTIEKSGEESIGWVIRQLEKVGLQVIQTFNLQEARLLHSNCPCPHHGTENCNCQIRVLLIYQTEKPPASVLIHSFQEKTWLYLVDTPEQSVDPKLGLLIRETLTELILNSNDFKD